jgi:myo-inositol-1(or 4)-monophosphatase
MRPVDEKEIGEDALLALACRLATDGGRLARRGRQEALRAGLTTATKSTLTDLVTVYDRAVEQLIAGTLREARPDDAIVGEEGTTLSGGSGLAWFVDPIDGTTNFVYGLPSWSTSVAVARDGAMVAGAVYVPVTDELFAARIGNGATLNGEPIRHSRCDDLSLALVATGFAYAAATRTVQARRVAEMISQIRDVRRLGSAAIDLCHVACGRVDAYYEEHLNAWDAAAGELIAREAGAVTSDFGGGPADPTNIVAASPAIHAALLELLDR